VKSPRNLHVWLPGYLRSRLAAARRPEPKRVWLLVCDHYEPLAGGRVHFSRALQRVRQWRTTWPEIASRHCDSTGKPAQYTFFYPQEDYQAEIIEPLAEMARMSIADVEVHIHHDGEGERDFVERMSGFIDLLANRPGLFRKVDGKLSFGFIHGNWALDNSRPDGRYCGLNNEIQLLRDLGCYADFTLPSAPSATQTSIVNTIYWATDDPLKPKSHDTGIPAAPRSAVKGDLLMVPGPLGLRMFDDGRLLPRIEMGELAGYDLPTRARTRRWLKLAPAIGEDVFIKLHTHGADDRNRDALLNGGLDTLFDSIQAECGERGVELRYGTAWDVYRAIMERLVS
jgi:hypothetical protein